MKEEIKSPLKAIKAHCIDCCNGQAKEVKLCPSEDCFLYPFRFGKNPFIKRDVTEEQRIATAERLKKARKNISNNKGDN